MGEQGGKKRVIGLTGGIASGKSTVSRELQRLGIPVVDADLLAREVVAPGSDGLREVVEAFGEDVLGPDGALDREKLGAIVFGDEAARKTLVGITHPRIARLSLERLAAHAEGDAPYLVYEAPLLIESGAHRGMDAIIVVAADEETQVRRVAERDGLDADQARARIAAQLPLADKVSLSDYVIDNDGTLDALIARTHEVHAQLVAAG